MVLLALAAVCMTICTTIFLLKKWLDTYWERRGLYTCREKVKGEDSGVTVYKAIKSQNLKYGGIIKHYSPKLMIVDLDIVKAILIKDAEFFLNRGLYHNPKVDPTSNTLPRLENDDWKSVRSLVSRIFSSGKMKLVFPALVEHAEILLEVIDKYAEANEAAEAKDLAKRFGMDTMGSCTFGCEIDTLRGKNKEFQEIIKSSMSVTWKRMAEALVNSNILKFLRIRISDPKVEKFFRNLVNETRQYREKNNVQRNDIFEYVREMTDKNLGSDELVKNQKLSSDQMVLQLKTFFVGGFETSSTLTSFAILELCLHQDIQEKLRENIRTSLRKHGKLTYDAVMEMEYLDWVIKETLRKDPPSPSLSRLCNKAYRIPGTNFIIQPGDSVVVSILGIQSDPDYYPEPNKFNPERFNPENMEKRHPMTLLPFGDGPRNCIGSRLGQLIVKVAIAAIISKFKVTLNEKTIYPIRYAPTRIFPEVEGGVWVNFSKVD